ncbi:hypothetical protein C8R45DRAFT_1132067 [Mycena sanguinolenta]|nr:hypothetical protein C8R45DRAFT_1132067 [Mycena sanguinolenta]
MSSLPSSHIDAETGKNLRPPRKLKRRRTIMACQTCRRRKIRCLTSEQPPINPCAYCKKKHITCEYVAVVDPDVCSSPSPDGDVPESRAASSSASSSPVPACPLPGPSSPQPFPRSAASPRLHLPNRLVNAPNPSLLQTSHGSFVENQSHLYDLQAVNAFQYLSNRTGRSQPSALPAYASPGTSQFLVDYTQMPGVGYPATPEYSSGWPDSEQSSGNFPQGSTSSFLTHRSAEYCPRAEIMAPY